MTDRGYWTSLNRDPRYADLLAGVQESVSLAPDAPPSLGDRLPCLQAIDNRRPVDDDWQTAAPTLAAPCTELKLRI